MSEQPVYFLTVGLILGTILLIFGMKYFSAARQAQRTADAQSQGAASLSVMQADLSEIKARLAAVEKILKAVE
jgi:hypothetical protein